jgi:ABC-type dipeptide/oligopeptide/nickel transport system permease subunit
MISQGQQLATTTWWVVTVPGLAVLLAAVAFNLLGDGLQTAVTTPGAGSRRI